MKIEVNGIEIPVTGRLIVRVEVDSEGETIPGVLINIRGGSLNIIGEPYGLVMNHESEVYLRGRDVQE